MKKKEAPPEEPVKRELNLSEIESFYAQKLNAGLHESEAKSNEAQQKILSLFSSLPVEQLKKASHEKEDKLFAAVNMTKDSYVKKVSSLLSSVPQPGKNYEDITSFMVQSKRILSELKDTNPKQSMALSTFFGNESAPLIKQLKSIGLVIDDFESFFQDSEIKKLSDVSSGVTAVRGLLDKMDHFEKRESSLKASRESREQSLGIAKKRIQEILESGEWKSMESLEEQIESMERDLVLAKAKIQGELAPLKRPFKKAKHALGDNSLDVFISSPLQTFLWDSGIQSLKNALESACSVPLKESEKQKLLSLKELADQGILEALRNRYISLEKNVEQKNEEMSSYTLHKEMETAEEEVKLQESKKASLENDMSQVRKSKESLFRELVQKRKSLEDVILKNFNDNAEIIIEGI